MLKVRNISAGYGGDDIVRDISFDVKDNENLCIIGPNGCGKTTLLKAVSNILPFRGDVEIDGISIKKMKRRDISLKIAMMSQNSGIHFSYSVFDTVMMGRYPHIKDRFLGIPSEEDVAYSEKCLEAVDMLDNRNTEITKLSGGQIQRVFLARTLAQEPEIILLDEPTNHLDLKYQIELIEYLKEWSKTEKHTVIGVLHDINLAMRLSENILVMKDGKCAASGSTNETITDNLLYNVYGIDVAGYMRDSLKRWEK